jgi:diguanylate cyclase (GGDEF)-like protein
LVARYGGEEFVILSVSLDRDQALEFFQSLCRELHALALPHEASPFGRVSISIGVAVVVPAQGASSAALVKNADEALYSAKTQGRNRAVLAG